MQSAVKINISSICIANMCHLLPESKQYSRYALLENRVFVPNLIFHSNQIYLLLIPMRAFVPGGKDRLPTHPVRPYLYRVAASRAARWCKAS
jgi:hypothetical protein